MLIGIVGKPSTGKSTIFKAATLAEVEIASYPFTTIKPNFGTGFVKVDCIDKEFNTLCNPRFGYCLKGKRFVPVELIDVAGLVEGAHEGKGLGSQFLDDLNQADALIHIIDISGSTNEKGEAVEPLSYDPLNDVKFLEHELDMWYLRILKKSWDKFARTVKGENGKAGKAIAKQMSGVRVDENIAENAIRKLNLDEDVLKWTNNDLFMLASELRKITKPMIIAANKIDINGAENNLKRLIEKFSEYKIIACSAESELALKEAAKKNLISYIPGEGNFEITSSSLNENQKMALNFVKENILNKYKSTGVQDVLDYAVFNLLGYIAIFPGGLNNLKDSEGRTLPDCFLMPKNSTSLDFAFRIHTDIGKKFVKAIDVKKKIAVGKEHLLKNRDVIEIKTS
ncbi:redox-regulated ATPase YchF [Candidatus Woesearchaeota archaeon]|nr:redox-regulated ATPase YchF [Candidatus Woesearchaeota archaeon]